MSKDPGPQGPNRTAVKTTIVGGQPPGNERALDEVPVGLEHALALAAAHPEFRHALRVDPDATLEAAGLALTPTERAILRATPEPALDQMVQRVHDGLTTVDRRRFLERAAAALALLLAAETPLGCKGDDGKQYGKPKESPAPPSRPGAPVQMQRRYEGYPHGSMGARPDYAPPMRPDPMVPPTRPTPEEAEEPRKPPPPRRRRPRRRPRYNKPRCMGIRPWRDRPRSRKAPTEDID